MSQNLERYTDGEKIEMLIDNLIVLYRELKKIADEVDNIHKKYDFNEKEISKATDALMSIKREYDNACYTTCLTLNEIKNSGNRLEIKIVKV